MFCIPFSSDAPSLRFPHSAWFQNKHSALLRPTRWWGFYNNRGIISPVMALTKTQKPPGGDQKRSEHIGHTQQLSHTLAPRITFQSVVRVNLSLSQKVRIYSQCLGANVNVCVLLGRGVPPDQHVDLSVSQTSRTDSSNSKNCAKQTLRFHIYAHTALTDSKTLHS